MEEDLKPGQAELLAETDIKEEESKEETPEAKSEPSESPAPEKQEAEKIPYKGKFKHINSVEDLEKNYESSFREAARLNDRIKELEAKLSEEDEPLDDSETIAALKAKVDRLEQSVKTQEDKQTAEYEQQYNKFVEDHPELQGKDEKDPLIVELNEAIAFVAQRTKQPLSMEDALKRAWKLINKQHDEQAELEGAKKVAMKDLAAGPAPTGAPSAPTDTIVLTEDEKRTAKTYGMTDEEYAEHKVKK